MDFGGMDKLFEYFFNTVVHIGKYVIAVKMASNLMKDYEAGNFRDMIQDFIGGGFAFGALTFILEFLDKVSITMNK
jgi:hypothetical protein